MKTVAVAIALMLTGAPTWAQEVQIGRVNWSKLPALKEKPSGLDYADLALRIGNMLRTDQCKIRGQSARRFDITVPYAALVEPDGKVSRVVIAEQGCHALEALAGEAVLARSAAGEFLPTGEAKARWYVSALNFNLR
ncbi:MAG TPA: hypothetical protein VM662_06375 [Sphingomonas sp.]|nr:hypothetical protein [Sphingomonas sp.]